VYNNFPIVAMQESVTFNRQLIVEVLWLSSCRNPPCTAKSTPIIPSGPKGTNGSVDIGAGGGERMTVDVSKCLAQMFVELVTPDVMYNGVAWPEEELIRFTLERYLVTYIHPFKHVPISSNHHHQRFHVCFSVVARVRRSP